MNLYRNEIERFFYNKNICLQHDEKNRKLYFIRLALVLPLLSII
jgi:hypothetical protein